MKQVIEKDQYLPVIQAEKVKTKTRLYRHWKIISPAYEALIEQSVKAMPFACSQTYQAESLLRHFAEVIVNQIIESIFIILLMKISQLLILIIPLQKYLMLTILYFIMSQTRVFTKLKKVNQFLLLMNLFLKVMV